MDSTWTKLTSKIKTDNLKIALTQTETAGRGLVANEDISKDEIIFTETPFVVGPAQTVGPHFCANCSQPLNVGVLKGKFDEFFYDFVTQNYACWHLALTEALKKGQTVKSQNLFTCHCLKGCIFQLFCLPQQYILYRVSNIFLNKLA